jgi:hypothetical protein
LLSPRTTSCWSATAGFVLILFIIFKKTAFIPEAEDLGAFCRIKVKKGRGTVLPVLTPEYKTWFKDHITHRYWLYGVAHPIYDYANGDVLGLSEISSFADDDGTKDSSVWNTLCDLWEQRWGGFYIAVLFESNADAANLKIAFPNQIATPTFDVVGFRASVESSP